MAAFVAALLALLLLTPWELWQAHLRKVRSLSPNELNLRRASQPLGLMAVSMFIVWRFGLSDDVAERFVPLVSDPAENVVPAALLAGALLYGLASFLTGAARSWGVRGDGLLPTRTFLKCAAGVVGLMLLHTETRGGGDFWAELWQLPLETVAIWCVVTGAVRFFLLSVGGGSALGRVRRHIRQTQIVMRPVRSRPWWRFW